MLQTRAELGPVAVGEGGAEAVYFVLVGVQGAEDFVPILFQDVYPHGGIAGRDAGRVFEPVTGELAPFYWFCAQKISESCGDELGKMADMGDDLIVLIGIDADDFTAKILPKLGESRDD